MYIACKQKTYNKNSKSLDYNRAYFGFYILPYLWFKTVHSIVFIVLMFLKFIWATFLATNYRHENCKISTVHTSPHLMMTY
jgi:hypothetical protein